jgi:hypothetical protein
MEHTELTMLFAPNVLHAQAPAKSGYTYHIARQYGQLMNSQLHKHYHNKATAEQQSTAGSGDR